MVGALDSNAPLRRSLIPPKWRNLALPIVAIAALFIPLVTTNQYYVHSVLAKVCIYTIVIAGLDLVVGYSGDVSVGHAGLFAAGAYTTAILMWKLHVPFPIAALAGVAVAALFGVLLGVPALRLTGPYLAVATIAFGLIIQTFVNEAVDLTNGSQGIREIPDLRWGRIDFEGNHFYYLVYPLMVLSLLAVHRIAKSYWGRAFEALKANAVAAECSGISRYRYKLSAFIVSAVFAGMAGALFVHIDKYIGPPTFSQQLSILFLIALIFGGTRSVFGNLIGTFVVIVLPDLFNRLAEYQLMIFGGLLLFTLYFMPSGISGVIGRILAIVFGRHDETSPVVARVSREEAEEAIVRPTLARSLGADAELLTTEDLTIAFGGLIAVNKLELRVALKEVHALIGPNGSGKSTTVNLLSGVYRPTGGRIRFAGKELERVAANRIARSGIARTFQNVALFSDMSVLENVLVGLHHTFTGGLFSVVLSTPKARRQEAAARVRAQSLLEFVGIGEHAGERARSLPYGKQRLLEIARALGQDPALILLDEPAAGLTSSEIAVVDDLIGKMRERGIAILLIEHHMDLVMAVSDKITVLDFGQKIATGKPEQIQRDERVISAYLGTTVNDAERAGALPAEGGTEDA